MNYAILAQECDFSIIYIHNIKQGETIMFSFKLH